VSGDANLDVCDTGAMDTTTPDTTTPRSRLAYSRVEAAAILGVNPATVDRLAKRGLLRPSRATRRPLYAYWELERFMRETSQAIEV
jgi:predicted urease superfamily metal-dependent hydrolase